ncbi:small integral membrane protein 1 [Amia ocellicauda]|uniref:small integral membrane protein 1 n=1 Tax=Amia ocellicauda TaxID=2972642 RepID=UPI0034645884|nr:SMIM1 protein [Amia calva]
MEPQETGVQYSRWNERCPDEINMNMSASGMSRIMGIYNRLCTGNLGIALKVSGCLVVLIVIYLIGYVTGYYVHKCK